MILMGYGVKKFCRCITTKAIEQGIVSGVVGSMTTAVLTGGVCVCVCYSRSPGRAVNYLNITFTNIFFVLVLAGDFLCVV